MLGLLKQTNTRPIILLGDKLNEKFKYHNLSIGSCGNEEKSSKTITVHHFDENNTHASLLLTIVNYRLKNVSRILV